MECLHAPWRIEYILAPKAPPGDPSVFTAHLNANDDVAHHIIARDRTCFAILNRYPYNGGHILVLPYKQAAQLDDLTDEEMADLMRLARRCVRALTRTMKPHGFNLGFNLGPCAGAGIAEHLHLHIVPRWNGDTNFMPVLAGTHVISEALTDSAAKLRAALAEDNTRP